jgi:hypothetical protein
MLSVDTAWNTWHAVIPAADLFPEPDWNHGNDFGIWLGQLASLEGAV